MNEPDDDLRHTTLEDAFALATGVVFVALGVELLRRAGLSSGGAPGLAILLHLATGLPFAPVLFAINLPFYAFAFLKMGWRFTLKTFIAVSLLTLAVWGLPQLLTITHVDPIAGAVGAGLLTGVGLLILIRHKSSLGGVGIMAVYLQDRFGWRAGKVQMAIDCVILTGSFLQLDLRHALLSILGAVVLNVVLWVNHRSGRYGGY
ncbi:MAG: YitT family protein [Hyphomicrobiaceae bacterium]|nr:YitT family protein [Hyphomicrobiaceae bacterium]